MIAYENFDLRIEEKGAGLVVTAELGAQSVSEPFKLSPRSWDLEQIELGGPEEIRKRGAELFRALIRGRVRDLYHRARGGTGSNAERGLRIRIQVDARNPRLRSFLQVPWELLCDAGADAGQLLALDPRRAIVRTIESNEPHVDPAPGELRRVLIASANPAGTDRLKLGAELERVSDALKRYRVQPVILKNATRATLQERIGDMEPQIVHFMGHGSLDSRHGEGLLLLERNRRGRDSLDAETFASFFAGAAAPRLVVLNSCLTAAIGRARTFNAFSSVAAALIAAGLPAVVAMQSTIRDSYAVKFSDAFYGALVKGDRVEGALGKARAALSALDRAILDWAAPVLYVRPEAGEVMQERPLESQATPPLSRDPNQRTVNHTIAAKGGVVIVGSNVYGNTIKGR